MFTVLKNAFSSKKEMAEPHVVDNSGMSNKRVNKFVEKNPDSYKIHKETYNKLSDTELKELFETDNKKSSAAVAIATLRLDAEGTLPKKFNNDIHKDNVIAEFKEQYQAALDDINNGHVNLHDQKSYLSKDGVNKIDNKVAKAKEKKSEEELKDALKTSNKENTVTVTQKCGPPKTCELTKYQLFKVAPSNSASEELLIKASNKSIDAINKILDKAIQPLSKPQDVKITDLNQMCEGDNSFHFVGSHDDQFQANFKIVAEGKCGHGLKDHCPTVVFETIDGTIADTREKKVSFINSDSRLNQLRLNPDGTAKSTDETKLAHLRELLDRDVKTFATYDVYLTACKKSAGESEYPHIYHDFASEITIHQSSVKKVAFSIGYDYEKCIINLAISAAIRQNNNTYSFGFNAAQISTDEINNFIPDGTLKTVVKLMGTLLDQLLKLGATDTTEDEAGEYEEVILNANNEPTSDNIKVVSGAKFKAPSINFSYITKKTNPINSAGKPDFSQVGYDKSIFISASPLFKYENEINILNYLYRTSVNIAIDIATCGASALARKTMKTLGIEENVTNSCKNFAALMINSAVKAKKQCDIFKKASESDIAAAEIQAEVDETSEEDVCEYIGSKESIKCMLTLSAAVETDDPAAGLVWTKRAGEEKFKFDNDSSSIYAGVNAQISGELSVDLQILKTVGFGKHMPDAGGGGIRGTVQSADRTGESRLYANLKYLKEPTEDGVSGLCYQVGYSGLSVFIQAFIWFGKTKTRGEDQEIEAVPVASGRRGKTSKTAVTPLDDVNAKNEKTKTLINFCIFGAKESKPKKISLGNM